MSKKFLDQKMSVWKNFGSKMSLGQKCFGSKEIWQNFGSIKIWVKRGFSLKKFEYQRIWSKKIGLKKLFGPKKSDKKKIWVKKIFGSHGPIFKVWLKLDWDIPLDSN